MDDNTFHILATDARESIRAHRLGDALRALRGMLAYRRPAGGTDCLDDITADYCRLIDYMARGFADEGRDRLYLNFLGRAFALLQSIRRADALARTTDKTDYAITCATLRQMRVPTEMAALTPATSASGRLVFETAWTSGLWTEEDLTAAREQFARYDATFAGLLVSGVTLGALHFFDRLKLLFLIDLLETGAEGLVYVRALVGMVLILLQWPEAYHLYGELRERLLALTGDRKVQRELAELQGYLILALDARRVEHKLNDEILPEVMKHAQRFKLDRKQQGVLTDWEEEMTRLTANPEWERTATELNDKMKAFADLQQRGVDVSLGLFNQIRQHLGFFNAAANWFYPFTTRHPDLSSLQDAGRLGTLLSAAGTRCDTDKYAFSLMMLHNSALIPKHLTEMMAGSDALPEGAADNGDSSRLMQGYVQDLYRFFNLYRGRDEQVNPFRNDLLLTAFPAFEQALGQSGKLPEIAAMALETTDYNIALKLLSQLEQSADVLQKEGYCYQALKVYDRAAEAYEKANLLEGESEWTLRQLAVCLRRTGRLEEAESTYARLEALCPDDGGFSLKRGECFIALGRFEDAQKTLYRAYYLLPDDSRVIRAMAWTFLQLKDMKQADAYYYKLLAADPIAEDYLNAGHAAWLNGNMQEAIQRYRTYLLKDTEKAERGGIFTADSAFLEAAGISRDELHIMEDLLTGNIKNDD